MDDRNQDVIIQNLRDAGCDQDTIACFIKLSEQEKIDKELCLLSKHRKELLDCVHENQKKIDCLDYLIYQLKKKQTCDSCNCEKKL